MGRKNAILLLVSFVVVLLWQMPFLSGESVAQDRQGYKEDGFWREFFAPTINVKIDNGLKVPLRVECYVKKKHGAKIIQPGQSFIQKYDIWTVTLAGPTVYCQLRWGISSLEFTAYNIWKESEGNEHPTMRYTLTETGLYKNAYGKMTIYIPLD